MLAASIELSIRIGAKDLLNEFVRVKDQLGRPQGAGQHFDLVIAPHDPIHNGGMYILFVYQEIGRLGDGIAIFGA